MSKQNRLDHNAMLLGLASPSDLELPAGTAELIDPAFLLCQQRRLSARGLGQEGYQVSPVMI